MQSPTGKQMNVLTEKTCDAGIVSIEIAEGLPAGSSLELLQGISACCLPAHAQHWFARSCAGNRPRCRSSGGMAPGRL
jgi:hypothetical protein